MPSVRPSGDEIRGEWDCMRDALGLFEAAELNFGGGPKTYVIVEINADEI